MEATPTPRCANRANAARPLAFLVICFTFLAVPIPLTPSESTGDSTRGEGVLLARDRRSRDPWRDYGRSFPSTAESIGVFFDQVYVSRMSDEQLRFVATHTAGTQKIRAREIAKLRRYNDDYLHLHYQLALGLGDHEVVDGDEWVNHFSRGNLEDACEPWFIHDERSQQPHSRLLQRDWDWYACELAGEGKVDDETSPWHGMSYRDYWVREALRRTAACDGDGVFADSCHALWNMTPQPNLLTDPGGASYNEFELQVNAFRRFVFDSFEAAADDEDDIDEDSPRRYLIPNVSALITSRGRLTFDAMDGCMIEGFANGFSGRLSNFNTGDFKLQADRALSIVNDGKIVIGQTTVPSGVEPDSAEGRAFRLFVLSAYLLLKGDYTYVNILSEAAITYFPEWELDLGEAETSARASIDELYDDASGLYVRRFDKGLVLLNPSDRERQVNLGRARHLLRVSGTGALGDDGTIDGEITTDRVTTFTVPAWEGAIVMNRAID